jgi:hypothetical protein
MTWPVAGHLSTHVAGRGGDPWQTLWRFEKTEQEARQAFNEGGFIAFVARTLLGGGEARLVNVSVWPWLPLHFLAGGPVTYNLVWLSSFFWAGLGMYYLVRQILGLSGVSETSKVHVAALTAGVGYMFLPFHVAHGLGHFGALQIQWLPWLVFAALRYFHSLRVMWAGLLAGLMVVQAWSEHHYALWFVLGVVLVGCLRWRDLTAWWPRARQHKLAAAVVIAGAVLIVMSYWPTIRLAREANDRLALGEAQTIRLSADGGSFFIPSPFHSLWGEKITDMVTRLWGGAISETTHFLGFIPLALVLAFYHRVPAQIRFISFVVGGFFAVVSLGPWLRIAGTVTAVPLPWSLIDTWPPFSAIRAVGRASIMVGLVTMLLFGCIVRTFSYRVWGLVLAGLLFEFLFVPAPLFSFTIAPVYHEVKKLGGERIFEIPANTNYELSSRALYGSLIHGKSVFGAIALERGSRIDEVALARRLPGVRHPLFLSTQTLEQHRTDFFGQDVGETFLDVARWLDVQAAIVHFDALSNGDKDIVRTFFEERLGVSGVRRGEAFLYTLPAPVASDGVFLIREDGWTGYTFDEARGHTHAVLEETADVTVVNMHESSRMIEFTFYVAEGDVSVHWVDTGEMLTQARTDDGVRVMITIPSGERRLRFSRSGTLPVTIINPQFTVLGS